MSALQCPSGFTVLQGNRVVSIAYNPVISATSYIIYRSIDGINFTTIATITATSYLDTTVTVGTKYWYQVAAYNGSITSTPSVPQSVIPTPTSEMSLGELRLACQQRADVVNSNFFTVQELNSYINQSMFELYDLLVTAYEDYFIAEPCTFTTDGVTYVYPLPDGNLTFKDGFNPNTTIVAKPFYKLIGLDLGVNTVTNAWVTINKFNFSDRNRYVYPNSQSTLYGVFNMSYRLMGNNIMFIPTPSANQMVRIWYTPRLTELLQDTDTTSTSISGWLEYVIVDVAIKMLQKEESDTSVLLAQKAALRQRIMDSSQYRDASRPNTIQDTRGLFGFGDQNNGPIGSFGGF